MLRLSVAPSGTAPEQARLRHASATADFRAFVRIEINVAAVAIHGHGDEFLGHRGVADFGRQFGAHHGQRIGLDADDRRVAAGQTTEPSRT